MPKSKAKAYIVEKEGIMCPFKWCSNKTTYCNHMPFMHRIKDQPNLFYCYHLNRIVKDLRSEKGDCNVSI